MRGAAIRECTARILTCTYIFYVMEDPRLGVTVAVSFTNDTIRLYYVFVPAV